MVDDWAYHRAYEVYMSIGVRCWLPFSAQVGLLPLVRLPRMARATNHECCRGQTWASGLTDRKGRRTNRCVVVGLTGNGFPLNSRPGCVGCRDAKTKLTRRLTALSRVLRERRGRSGHERPGAIVSTRVCERLRC